MTSENSTTRVTFPSTAARARAVAAARATAIGRVKSTLLLQLPCQPMRGRRVRGWAVRGMVKTEVILEQEYFLTCNFYRFTLPPTFLDSDMGPA